MKSFFSFLGLALAAVGFGSSALAGDAAGKGKIIRVRTDTCIIFDVEEQAGGNGAAPAYAIKSVFGVPSPDSRLGYSLGPWLAGATVSGLKVVRGVWHLKVEVSGLSVKLPGAAAPLTTEELVNHLQTLLRSTITGARQAGELPASAVVPLISATGITSGTATVTFAGSDATPVTPLPADELPAAKAEENSSKAAPGDKR